MACVLAERSCSALGFLQLPPCAHGRRRPAAPPHRTHRAGELAPRLRSSPDLRILHPLDPLACTIYPVGIHEELHIHRKIKALWAQGIFPMGHTDDTP
eukprot:786090-Pleurochrysis_carterae.AAC.1